ncbi:hypothetical protein H6F50_20980 [Coleofasciculus sp. FACHB-712]|uniref:WD40/YVTN/BNR-like repeat-containing protein n=1 Tax=Coleofasciculus sp. FACHB-712 TaxID=2692789 RepID=UPI001684717A|nr:hypothetical protein [Coleofasciculus sp. FACHB-712]MBD1944801.1 hypothetical protein [Coleofasciculus sp. FACHB-712]
MKEKTYYGEEAIATDPINPNIVYMAAGKYSQRQPKGSIFKSTERGKNWTKLNINLGIDSNVEHCWVGKRLALNPANSNIIFFDSRHDGVWRSSNAGATMGESRNFISNAYQRRWHLVRVGGSRWNSTSTGATSTDGGLIWKKLASFPASMPLRVAISAPNPNLFVVAVSKALPLRTTDDGASGSAVSGLPNRPEGPWY